MRNKFQTNQIILALYYSSVLLAPLKFSDDGR